MTNLSSPCACDNCAACRRANALIKFTDSRIAADAQAIRNVLDCNIMTNRKRFLINNIMNEQRRAIGDYLDGMYAEIRCTHEQRSQ